MLAQPAEVSGCLAVKWLVRYMAGHMVFETGPGFNIPFLPFLPCAGPHLQNGGDGFHLPFKGF